MRIKIFKVLAAAMTISACMGTTVCAAPKQMADGVMFDPQYYAQANPDVVAALGSDENILYKHYALYGKAEGRAALAASQPAATPLPAQGEVIAWASDPGDKTVSITGKSGKVYTYSLPTLKGRWEKWGLEDQNTDPDSNWAIFNGILRDEFDYQSGLYNEAAMMEVIRAAQTMDFTRIQDLFGLDASQDLSFAGMSFYEQCLYMQQKYGAPAGDFVVKEISTQTLVGEGVSDNYVIHDSNWGDIWVHVGCNRVVGDPTGIVPKVISIEIGEW